MGTAEHERYVQQASRCNVDTIQTVNVPTVAGDENYSELLSHMAQSTFALQRDFAAAMQTTAGSMVLEPSTDPPTAAARGPARVQRTLGGAARSWRDDLWPRPVRR